jgi:hypothetical protein
MDHQKNVIDSCRNLTVVDIGQNRTERSRRGYPNADIVELIRKPTA